MPFATASKFAVFATDPITLREVEIGRGDSQCETIALERAAKLRGMKNVYTSLLVP